MSLEKLSPVVSSAQEPTPWPENPWLEIWTRPRATIRAIVDSDPERYVILLAALNGVAQALDNESLRNAGDSISLVGLLLLAVIIGPISGVMGLYFGGVILRWTGSILQGKATSIEVRAAIAWSSVPTIMILLLWIPELAMYGQEMFSSTNPGMHSNPWGILFLSIIEIVIAVWAFILLLKCLAEVQRFSVWKALGSLAIPAIVVIVPLAGCALIASL